MACSTIQVPLDYSNPGAGTATLAVGKIPATETKIGTIFVGGSASQGGLAFLDSNRGERLFNITGRAFDLVSWDGRGTGLSTPAINCFDPVKDQNVIGYPSSTPFSIALNKNASLTIKSSGPTQADIETFLSRTSAAEAVVQGTFQNCTSKHASIVRYLGMAASARDLVAIADAVQGSSSSINFYGVGYGSVIGVYLMRLFPQRLGKIVVDGIVDAAAYTTQPSYSTYGFGFSEVGPAFNAFFEACAKVGPPSSLETPGCMLARQGSTAWDIQQRINKLIDDMYELSRRGFGSFAPEGVYNALQGLLSAPDFWNLFSVSLYGYEEEVRDRLAGNFTESPSITKRQSIGSDHIVDKLLSAGLAIECGDAPDAGNTTTRGLFEETVRVTRDIAGLLGPAISLSPYSYCHLWPVRAVERLTVPPEIEIPGSILIIGNTYDVATPLENAANLFRRIKAKGTKRLVQHDVVGHSSLGLRSACTQDIMRKYYSENILPGSDVRCGANEAPSFLPFLNTPPEPSSTSIISAPIAVPTAGSIVSSALRLAGPPAWLPFGAIFFMVLGLSA